MRKFGSECARLGMDEHMRTRDFRIASLRCRGCAIFRAVGSESGGHNVKSVLLVDDDAMTRTLYKRCLKSADIDIVCASSAREGLALLSRESFDLLLLDIIMPEITGLELLEQLTADGSEAMPPVIMLSAMQDASVTEQCKALGADSVLVKPVPATILRAQVRRALEL